MITRNLTDLLVNCNYFCPLGPVELKCTAFSCILKVFALVRCKLPGRMQTWSSKRTVAVDPGRVRQATVGVY